MDFQRLSFEQVHKSSKKLAKITKDTIQAIIEEIETVNFSKIIEEIPKVILDTKFEPKDVPYIVKACTELNLIYESFDKHFKEALIKELKALAELKTKNEDDEEKKNQRRKCLYKLLIESYLFGLIDDFALIRELFKKLVSKNKDEINFTFPLLVHILKSYAELLFGIKPKPLVQLIEESKISNYELIHYKEKETLTNFETIFHDYYYKVILPCLEEKNKTLAELEKKNMENMSKLDASNELQEKYTKQRSAYLKFLNQIKDLAMIINVKLPEIASDKFMRIEESRKAAVRVEKVNKFDPFSDQTEYSFYTKFIDLKESDLGLHEKILNKKEKDLKEDEEFQKKKFDNFCSNILRCDSQEVCDEMFIEFVTYLNSNRYRKAIPKLFLRGSSKTNFSLLKYYARFTRLISVYFKEIKEDIIVSLIEDFNSGFNSDKLNNMDERCKNIKFIGEMVKFDLFPINTIMSVVISRLFEDFKQAAIELLCLLLDSCGRYLFVHELSHIKFNAFLSDFKTVASHKIYYDIRLYNSVLNSIQICKPNEHLLKKKVKVRTIEEEYIKYLILSEMNKDNVKKVAAILRKMNWNSPTSIEANKEEGKILVQVVISHENYIFKYIYKLLVKGKIAQIDMACILLIHLKDSHPNLIINILQTLLEELRIGLERQDFEDNQHKLHICTILGQFYNYKLISTDHIFWILFFILMYSHDYRMGGVMELKDVNNYDSDIDCSRILMLINILEISGEFLKKERLQEFVGFFELYILTKKFFPTDIENRVLNVLEYLLGKNLKIYDDFNMALKEVSKFKGFEEEKDGKSLYDVEGEEHHKLNMKHINLDEKDEFDRGEPFAKRNAGRSQMPEEVFDFDEEFKKILNESINKAKDTKISSNVINPEEDMKKLKGKIKDDKPNSGFKLITKRKVPPK